MSSGLAGPRGKPWEAGVSVPRAGGGVRPGDRLRTALPLAPAGGGSRSIWKWRGRGLHPCPSWPAAPHPRPGGFPGSAPHLLPPRRKPLCRVKRPGATSASAPPPSSPCVSRFARRERLAQRLMAGGSLRLWLCVGVGGGGGSNLTPASPPMRTGSGSGGVAWKPLPSPVSPHPGLLGVDSCPATGTP